MPPPAVLSTGQPIVMVLSGNFSLTLFSGVVIAPTL